MRKQENGGACGRRCNYDGRETETGGQQEPTHPDAAGPQLRRPGNTRRIGSGSLSSWSLRRRARCCAASQTRPSNPSVGRRARLCSMAQTPAWRYAAAASRGSSTRVPQIFLREVYVSHALLGRQSQSDRTHSAPTYWLRERLRGPPSVSLLPHIGGIKRMPTKNGPGDRPRRAIPWSQVRFPFDSPLEGRWIRTCGSSMRSKRGQCGPGSSRLIRRRIAARRQPTQARTPSESALVTKCMVRVLSNTNGRSIARCALRRPAWTSTPRRIRSATHSAVVTPRSQVRTRRAAGGRWISNFWSLNQSGTAGVTSTAMAGHIRHVCLRRAPRLDSAGDSAIAPG